MLKSEKKAEQPRGLVMNRETVRELTADEVASAVGGNIALTGVYPTINTPCQTVQTCIQE